MPWQPIARCLTRRLRATRPALLLSPLWHHNSPHHHHHHQFLRSLLSTPPPSLSNLLNLCPLLLLFWALQETPARTEKGAGAQKTAHQEAAKRLHALHERDARQRGRRVHAEGERRHQSDPGTEGRCRHLRRSVALVRSPKKAAAGDLKRPRAPPSTDPISFLPPSASSLFL